MKITLPIPDRDVSPNASRGQSRWAANRLILELEAELRSEGINVKTTKIKRNGKTFAQYSL